MIYVSIFIAALYLFLIVILIIGFDKIPFVRNKNSKPKNTFSIAIPFRDEAENLPQLLRSLGQLNYPKHLFEVLLINDESRDGFQTIIDQFTAQNPQLSLTVIDAIGVSNSPKKDAINTAIKTAKFDWIITTDADCEVPVNWLQLFNQCIEKERPLFISAPVKFKDQNSLLFHFQNLHFISLIGSTIGGFGIGKPFLCNGANLCYSKETFIALNGFEGNTSIASGDDVFLLEKMHKKHPEKTCYLKSPEVTVVSKSEKNWSLFFNQQLRWASKSTAYKNGIPKLVGFLVFAMNLLVLLMGILSFMFSLYWSYFLILIILKSLVDFMLIFKSSTFLKSTISLKYFLGINLLYPFFIVYIGSFSLFKSYSWKGRNFRK